MQGSSNDYTTATAIAALLKRERSNAAMAAALSEFGVHGARSILQQNILGLQGMPNPNFMSSLALHGARGLFGIADGPNFSVPSAVDPIRLANIIAAQRPNKLAEAAEQIARMTEAHQRGRDEALLTLVRSRALDIMSLQRAASYQQVQSAPQLTHIAASSSVSLPAGMQNLLQEASSTVPKNLREDVPAIVGDQRGVDRRKVASSYFDASALQDPDAACLANRRTRGGVTEPFPEKLHRMLKEVEAANETDILSFFPHGRAFAVHNPTRFVAEVMPKYFRQSRLSSFQRQLNLYGFTRISSGPDSGGYYHELFLKGRPALSIHMRRVGVPQGAKGSHSQKISGQSAEPNFYAMQPIKGEITAKDDEPALDKYSSSH